MRNALHLPETSRATTKSNKLVDSASLGRPTVVPLKCAAPVSPSSVCLLQDQHSIEAALKRGSLETYSDDPTVSK